MVENQRMNNILNAYWDGIEYGTGKSCAQITLMALAEYFDIDEPWLEDVATPFGGGVCHTHVSICGAGSGALIFLGLKEGKENSAQIGAEMLKHIEKNFGSLHCDKILSIDFEDEVQVAREKAPKYTSICQPMMRSICSWITSRLEEKV